MVCAKIVVWLFVAAAVVKPPVKLPRRAVDPDPLTVALVPVGATYPAPLMEGPRVPTSEDRMLVLGLTVDGHESRLLGLTISSGLVKTLWALKGSVASTAEMMPVRRT